MATYERSGLLTYKDAAGNMYLLYPITKVENVDGLEDALAGKVSKIQGTATLLASGWSNNTQTVNVSGVTADNTVIVGADPAYYTAYAESNVRCTGQGEGTLTFECEEVPPSNLQANVLILN